MKLTVAVLALLLSTTTTATTPALAEDSETRLHATPESGSSSSTSSASSCHRQWTRLLSGRDDGHMAWINARDTFQSGELVHLVVCRPWSKWKRRFAGLFSTPRLRAPALTVTVHEWKPSEESSEEAWVKPLLSEQPSSPADRSTPSSGSYRSAPFASATVGKQRPKLRDRNLPADCSLLGEIGSREYGDPLSIDFHVASDFDALHKGWIVPTVPKDVDRFTVIQPEWRRHESPSPSGHGQRRLHAVEVACYNVQLELPEISPQQKTSMVEFRASMHHLFKRQQVVLGTAKVFAEGQLTSDVTPVPFGSVSTVDAAMGGATGGPATFGIRVGHVGDNDKLLLGSKDNELVLEILATGEVPSSTSSSEVTDESDDEHSFQKMQVTIVLEDGRLLHNVGRTIIHSETIDVAIGSTPDHEAETEAHITFPVPRSIIVDRKMHWRFLPGRYILRVFVKRADGGDGEWHAVDRVVELAQPADTVHFLEVRSRMNVGSNTNNMPVTDINPDQRYFMPVDVLTSPTMVIVSDEYGNHEDFRLPLIDCGSHMIPSKKCVDLTMIFRDIEQRLLEENSLPQELTIMAGNAHTSKVRIDQW